MAVNASTEPYSQREIEAALRSVGIGEGDTVYIHAALHRLGPPAKRLSRHDYLEMFLNAFRSVVGPSGTLIVPTFTTQVMRYGLDYIHEETPSLMGVFSEHIRLLPGAIRRLHPTNSFAAVGPQAPFICDVVSLRDAGMHSPYDRMIQLGAKIVSLGTGKIYAVSLAHHLESLHGPPHIYNKLLSCRVFKGGREVHLPFVLGARYLHLDVQYDLTRFVEAVEAAGGIAEARLGRGTVHKSEMRSVYSVGAALIQNDWFAFLAKPPEFPPGVVPNDGFTGTAENLEQAPANLIGYYL